ncbi:MAG: chemotaxis protein CheW [Deltaproteobacteria bacterium]|nr:chemotaxis protein CheW [Deltaproteobacteria bacterium]
MSETAGIMDQAAKAMAKREGKYLTFMLADEECDIGILKIKEIIDMMPIITIPQMPEFAKGVINLRGNYILVIDLRSRSGENTVDNNEWSRIIVVEVEGRSGIVQVGMVIDRRHDQNRGEYPGHVYA